MPSSIVNGLLESAEAKLRAAVARDISLIQSMPSVGPPSTESASGQLPVVGTVVFPAGAPASVDIATALVAAPKADTATASGPASESRDKEADLVRQDDLTVQINGNKKVETSSELPPTATVVTSSDQAEVARSSPSPRLPPINEEYACVDGDAFPVVPKLPSQLFPKNQWQPTLTSVSSALGPIPRITNAPADTWIHCWVTQVSDLLEHFSNEINRVRERIDLLESSASSQEASSIEVPCWSMQDQLVEVVGRYSEEFRAEMKTERETRMCDIAQLWNALSSVGVDKERRELPAGDALLPSQLIKQPAPGTAVYLGKGNEYVPPRILKAPDVSGGSLESARSSLGSNGMNVQDDRFQQAAGQKWEAISEDLSELRARLTEQLSKNDQVTPASSRASLGSSPVRSYSSSIAGSMSVPVYVPGCRAISGSKLPTRCQSRNGRNWRRMPRTTARPAT